MLPAILYLFQQVPISGKALQCATSKALCYTSLITLNISTSAWFRWHVIFVQGPPCLLNQPLLTHDA